MLSIMEDNFARKQVEMPMCSLVDQSNSWLNTDCSSMANPHYSVFKNIVACQRGGVSNEPPGQRQDTGPGILWSVHRWTRSTGEPPTCGVEHLTIDKLDNHLDKIFKRNEPHT